MSQCATSLIKLKPCRNRAIFYLLRIRRASLHQGDLMEVRSLRKKSHLKMAQRSKFWHKIQGPWFLWRWRHRGLGQRVCISQNKMRIVMSPLSLRPSAIQKKAIRVLTCSSCFAPRLQPVESAPHLMRQRPLGSSGPLHCCRQPYLRGSARTSWQQTFCWGLLSISSWNTGWMN